MSEPATQSPATHLIVGGAMQGMAGQTVVACQAVQCCAHCAAKFVSVALLTGTNAQVRQ